MEEERDEFLKATKAVQIPMELYALWLAVWKQQGGKVATRRSYKYALNDGWMPTKPHNRIPTNLGISSMTLLVLPDLVSIGLRSTSGDRRKGREWGHNTVMRLMRNGSGLKATTNKPSIVESFPDVEAFLKNNTLEALQSNFLESIKSRKNPGKLSITS